MSGRGGRGRYWRESGRFRNFRGRGDDSGGSSGFDRNERKFERGGRPSRGRPPGLRGKEIGLYYRDLHRSGTKKVKLNDASRYAARIGISLDPRREEGIQQLLKGVCKMNVDSVLHVQPHKVDRHDYHRSMNVDRHSFSYNDLQVKIQHDHLRMEDDRHIKMEHDDADDDSNRMESGDSHSRLDRDGQHSRMDYEDHYDKLNNLDMKQEQQYLDSEEDLEYIDENRRFKRERSWERIVRFRDVEPDQRMEESNGRIRDIRSEGGSKTSAEMYSHLAESKFKYRFLQSIMGSLEQNLDRSLQSGVGITRDVLLDERLRNDLVDKQRSNDHYRDMLEFRRKLPSYEKRHEIVNLVDQHQVVVINGETGCGKTTQVSQFILDDYIMRGMGSVCHIICTQPRRISAITVAERVADERAEPCGGAGVGYQIRVERKLPRTKGSILFCTTGVLLQWMQSNVGLTGISHIILDEIHERDTVSDFVMTILKDIIPRRTDLKLILMSATLNAEQFSVYYGRCPSLNIPGFTFPVQEFYLEDVLKLTKFRFKPPNNREGWRKHLRHNKLKSARDKEFEDFIEPYVRNLSRQSKYSDEVLKGLSNPESEALNVELICELLLYICRTQAEGAVLVFLPGWDNISKLHKLISDSGQFPMGQYLVIPLHSMMPTVNQKSVFKRPPKGVRKIILATNIAETSITIDDVVYVVDGGKIKMKNFNAEANIVTLQAEWESLANAKQRRGRAGRVQPGVCYYLFSRAREKLLEAYMLPEMLRTRLDEVILQIKILQLGKAQQFLAKVMNPPDSKAIEVSLQLLYRLNALDDNENLTPLGYHLAKLPMDPQTAKMILMGAIFSCVDPILSVAASLSFKDAFVVPLGKEKDVDRKKSELAGRLKSDHLVLAEAFKQWEKAEQLGRGREFCWDNYLSTNTLHLLRDMKKQFAEHLYDMNFLSSNNPKAKDANINSKNISLIKAVICSGLYPNVAFVHSVRQTKSRVFAKLSTPEDGRVSIHPRSINEKESVFESPFLIYFLKLKSSAIFLHDTTMIYPLSLLFFGEGFKFSIENGKDTITVSESIRFYCQRSTANIVSVLRERLLSLLDYKISHPGVTDWDSSREEGAILRAIVQLITYEDNQLSIHPNEDYYSDSE